VYRKVLIAFDGSEDSRAALNQGADLAALSKADVVLLSVLDTGLDVAAAEAYASGSADDDQIAAIGTLLEQERVRLQERGIAVSAKVAFGHPPEQILEQARELGVDLVVIGHRTHGLWSRLANDAVGVQLVRTPPCSILVVPPRG
jgi:nucleotide-binding universal stress UspA family protein